MMVIEFVLPRLVLGLGLALATLGGRLGAAAGPDQDRGTELLFPVGRLHRALP